MKRIILMIAPNKKWFSWFMRKKMNIIKKSADNFLMRLFCNEFPNSLRDRMEVSMNFVVTVIFALWNFICCGDLGGWINLFDFDEESVLFM
jgi:hypothetical protein